MVLNPNVNNGKNLPFPQLVSENHQPLYMMRGSKTWRHNFRCTEASSRLGMLWMDGCFPHFSGRKKWGNITMTQQFSHQLPPKVSENIPTLKTEEKKKQKPSEFQISSCSSRCITKNDQVFQEQKHHQIYFFWCLKTTSPDFSQNKSPSVPLKSFCHHSIERLPPSRWGRSFYGLVTVGVSQTWSISVGFVQHNLMTWWEFLSVSTKTTL